MSNQHRCQKRVGILTGGGDCPGLNAVIRAVAKTCMTDHGATVIGFEDGYDGMVNNHFHVVSYNDVSGILTQGGTILGTSNTISPFTGAITPSTRITMTPVLKRTLKNIQNLKLDALFTIGGDGTLSIAESLFRLNVPVIGIPKTIDNDLSGTDFTFGFNTACQIACDAIDRLHSTAMSHHRIMIIEVMGRYAGWLALYSGIAGGGDIILIPEIPYDIGIISKQVLERNKKGKRFSIIVIAEGARQKNGSLIVHRKIKGSPDPIRLGGAGNYLANHIEKITRLETRVTTLGHLQRGGTPTAYDRILATRFGVEAVRMACACEFGSMVALKGNAICSVTLKEAVQQLKRVPHDHPLIRQAASIGTSFGI